MLLESSGNIGRVRIVSGIVAIDSSHPKYIWKDIKHGDLGKDRECSDRFGIGRNRFLAPENIKKDTKHGVSSFRECLGKIGIIREKSGVLGSFVDETLLVPVTPMLRGFMPQKYPFTPIRSIPYLCKKHTEKGKQIIGKERKLMCPLRKLFFGTRAEPTVTEGEPKHVRPINVPPDIKNIHLHKLVLGHIRYEMTAQFRNRTTSTIIRAWSSSNFEVNKTADAYGYKKQRTPTGHLNYCE
ncbi:hypothetical protein NQ317_015469 [Molorchus minor]|uniref:Uncharacterized protein n=1 Tax=Molorchus minor TaxID=1323400 RepID=A0ABQ9J8Y8_9CUCU|nr:hypothetical protein NQ317_015469 [Molorchus minor]